MELWIVSWRVINKGQSPKRDTAPFCRMDTPTNRPSQAKTLPIAQPVG